MLAIHFANVQQQTVFATSKPCLLELSAEIAPQITPSITAVLKMFFHLDVRTMVVSKRDDSIVNLFRGLDAHADYTMRFWTWRWIA
jgi:hypothetical protein